MRSLCIVLLCLVSLGVQGQIITTWAGGGSGGGTDGVGDGLPKESAVLINPGYIFFDRWGSCYFPDQNEHRIRKVDTLGIITCIAGIGIAGYNGDGGLADTSKLDQPGTTIVDSIGNIYIADAINHRLRKIDHASGLISTIAGTGVVGYSGDNGPAINAQLSLFSDICFDNSGNLLISDNTRIRKISRSGIITTIAGYVNSHFISTVNGGLADTSAIGASAGICVDKYNNIYTCDGNNVQIYKISTSGIITSIAGTGTGYLYNGDNIPAKSAQISPHGIRINPINGNLYFFDYTSNDRIRMIDSAGVIHTVAGNGKSSYTGDNGPADSAGLPLPGGIGFDNCGNLYISQVSSPARIRKVTFDTACHLRIAQTGVNNVATTLYIKIYPNPTSNVLHIEAAVNMQYTLMNVVGAIVQQGALKAGSNSVDVERLVSGVYVLEVSDGVQRMVRKVEIMR